MRLLSAEYSFILLLSAVITTESFFNGIFNGFTPKSNSVQSIDKKTKDIEIQLLRILENTDVVAGRGAKLSDDTLREIESSISKLEDGDSTPNPTNSPDLDGCWKLLYTSSPGTNSPIQRTFTAFDGVSVYQVVNTINTENSFLPGKLPDVSNTVCFGDSARLRVTALASTVSLHQSCQRPQFLYLLPRCLLMIIVTQVWLLLCLVIKLLCCHSMT
jgi:PAP_fibrillin